MALKNGKQVMSTAALPQKFVILSQVGGQPLGRAWFEFELPMRRKDSYRLPVGPADPSGELRIGDAQLRAAVKRVGDLFPMDYVGIDGGWTGEILVHPVDRVALTRLRGAYATWGHTGSYPRDFPKRLDELEGTLASLRGELPIDVSATAEPAGHARSGRRGHALMAKLADRSRHRQRREAA